jgi:(1->4)-alpha-D-glucan 1-alpha-D-glucosylmutase
LEVQEFQVKFFVLLYSFLDIYQGTEVWDFSLVDPDNRRPVDYDLRRRYLASIQGNFDHFSNLIRNTNDGRIKMYLLVKMLELRRNFRECFGKDSQYKPLEAVGKRRRHVVSFERLGGKHSIVFATGNICFIRLNLEGRFFAGLGNEAPIGRIWEDTFLKVDVEGNDSNV